jgi:hypothetical protein
MQTEHPDSDIFSPPLNDALRAQLEPLHALACAELECDTVNPNHVCWEISTAGVIEYPTEEPEIATMLAIHRRRRGGEMVAFAAMYPGWWGRSLDAFWVDCAAELFAEVTSGPLAG